MISVSCQINIARGPAEVFAFVTDPSKLLQWQSTLVEAHGQPGFPAGSDGTVVMQVLGQRLASRFEIVDNDGHSRYTARSSQGPVQYYTTQRVEPAGGGSLVVYEVRIDAGTVFRLAETALEAIALSRFDSDLITLKAILEAGRAASR